MYSGPSIIQTPLVTADGSGVRIIEIVCINKMTQVMVIGNFPVVLTITIELLK